MRSSNIQVGPWTKSPNNFSLVIQITERDKRSQNCFDQMVQSSLNQAAAHIDLHCWSHRLEPDSQFLELISKVEEKEEIQDDQTVDLNGMGLPIAKGLIDRPVVPQEKGLGTKASGRALLDQAPPDWSGSATSMNRSSY